MPKTKQVTAWVESKPGELARITEALGKAKVNITAFSGWSIASDSPFTFWLIARQRHKRSWRVSASAAPKRRCCG